jgi:hypothetical protein
MAVWIAVAIIAVCGFMGWRAGLVRRLIELIGVVVAIVASARLASAVTPWLHEHTAMSDTAALLLSYVLVFVAALVGVRLVAAGVSAVIHWTPLGWIDSLIAVSNAPKGEVVRDTFTADPVGDLIYHAAPALYQGARAVVGQDMDELWEKVVDLGGDVRDEAEDKVRQVAPGS